MNPLEATSANKVRLRLRQKTELEFGKSENTGAEFFTADALEGKINLPQLNNLPDEIFSYSKQRGGLCNSFSIMR